MAVGSIEPSGVALRQKEVLLGRVRRQWAIIGRSPRPGVTSTLLLSMRRVRAAAL
jgi:hypothetical protein